jgi:WS/DGAT/MGAT family acyltransferase
MTETMQFAHRMSDSDALMWRIEKDPLLRSTVTALWILDRSPDRSRLEDRLERATRLIPRLRQRVVSNPMSIAPPRWEIDPNFDLAFHVRWMKAPGRGTVRDLLDVAQPMAMQGFDRARPLWELAIVEGLEEGRSGMVMKLHHSISDGVGLVNMTASMVETWRDLDPERKPKPMPPAPEAHVMTQWERFFDALGHEWRRSLGRGRRIGNAVGALAANPLDAIRGAAAIAVSTGRLTQPASESGSAILRPRSLSLRFETLEVPLDRMKRAAKRAGARVNDAFVAGICGGFARYHERRGGAVDHLRMTMPINLREADSQNVAGNRFVPARFDVPLDIADPIERMRTIQRLVGQQRSEPALPIVEEISGLFNRLPTAVSTWLLGSMLKGIDFVTSNVPGPELEVYLSGAKIEEIYGFGPLSGAAVNTTLFSFNGVARIGINADRAAVPDSGALRDCLREGLEEVLAVAPEPKPAAAVEA